MSRKVLVIAIVSACLWATASSDAQAQRPNRSVSRPTLSPYLNLYRHDIGFSDPRLGGEMSPYLRYFQADQQRTRRDTPGTTTGTYPAAPSAELLRTVNRNQQQQQVAVGIAPTGTNSSFMNMGHFYQVRNQARSPMRSPARSY
jgi:hypothetical protein